jgi:hypothetical protein
MNQEMKDEIKATVTAKILIHGQSVREDIRNLSTWISEQTKEMNPWVVAPYLINDEVCADVVVDIHEKFNAVGKMFKESEFGEYLN